MLCFLTLRYFKIVPQNLVMRIRSYDPELQRAYQDSIILIKSLPAHSYIDYGKEVVCQ